MNYFLIGMMGSGKTTAGKSLAKALGYDFVDTDLEIEKLFSLSVSEVFAQFGEKAFRLAETKVLNSICQKKDQVIATGGGLPCHHNNMLSINECGRSIYLSADPAFLLSRLQFKKQNRPLIARLSNEELLQFLEELIKERMKYYNQAHIHFEAKDFKAFKLVEKIQESFE